MFVIKKSEPCVIPPDDVSIANWPSDSCFIIWEFGYSRDYCLPDVECILTTSLSIEQVRDYMKLNDDSHVMIETLNYADQYDGERNQID